MMFASDNTGPAHPDVLQAVMEANASYAKPYGNDPWTEAAVAGVRALFEAPDAYVGFVSTGSVANALALACMSRPWDGILCHKRAHIEEDECGAPEFYSGAKLVLVGGENGRMDPAALEAEIKTLTDRDIHGVQPGPVSLTSVTELGTVYSLTDIQAISAIAKRHGLQVHLDGARFANACAALGCTPAEMTWKSGVDAVSFGGTKNGCMGVEAVVIFDPAKAREFELRRKQGGHLLSKHRYLAAQMAAYTANDLWLQMARSANARMAELLDGLATIPAAETVWPPAANLAFLRLPASAHKRAFAAGAVYSLSSGGNIENARVDAPQMCRVVCDWSMTSEKVQALLDAWRG